MKKIALLSCFLSTSVFAYDWEVTGKIVRIEPTYADHLNIRIDKDAGACSKNAWIFFYGHGASSEEKKESVKAVYSGLLASMYSGKNVVFYGANSGCLVSQVHLLPN